uniref:DUF1736 domain-containing protein n=1 Tax=Romanomermis culicivorax TaxID=13658 RepID=A0A915K750_ROMCU
MVVDSDEMDGRTRELYKILIPFTLAIFSYSNSLNGNFVFDDLEAVVNNPVVAAGGRGEDNFFQALVKYDFWGHNVLSNNSHKSWRPLTTLSFRVNMVIHGMNPVGFHLVNILLHATVVVLFQNLLRSVFEHISSERRKNDQIAYFSTLIFAVHPIHTESVTGIVGRAEVLCALFFVMAIKRFFEMNTDRGTTCRIPISCTIFATASLLCKEQGIMCLVVCVLLHFLIRIECNAKLLKFSDIKIFTILNYNYLYALNLWLLINPCSLCYDYSMGCIPVINGPWDVRIIIVLFMWAAFYTVGRSMWSENLHNIK